MSLAGQSGSGRIAAEVVSCERIVVEGYAARFPAAAREIDKPINLRTELKRILTDVEENELALKFAPGLASTVIIRCGPVNQIS